MNSIDEVLEYIWRYSYKPMTVEELSDALQHGNDISSLKAMLDELERQGEIVLNRKGRYGLTRKMNLRAGRLERNPKGFAFLIPDDPTEQDVFILGEDQNGAMHNDRVIVQLYRHLNDGRKREGKVIRVLQRANEEVVGTFERSRRFAFVTADDKRLGYDIFIPGDETGQARDGDKVVVKMTAWPAPRRNPEGKVIAVLGHKDQPGTDILSIVHKYRLPVEFPAKVMQAAAEIVDTIDPAEISKRKDLRHLRMVTIDGEDAKDLDDAVSLERLPNGNYSLGVHIADVGYYVREGSPLDEEAARRATSVYLVDRVIPMLPPRLSNGVCSLNAGEDRLAMTCFMEIDDQGEVKRHEICPTVIRVGERMTYTAVRRILEDKDAKLSKRYATYMHMFALMKELCLVLREKRLRRGAIDFDFPEAKVKLDEKGRPLEIIKAERSIAEMIIEEFMIAANETVAGHYHRAECPFLYRVHEEPVQDVIGELNDFLGSFGYRIKTGKRGQITPRDYQKVVEKVKGRPEERAVTMSILRSMKHARYAPEALGHFGLASQYYSHFTSPIRRYPDLAIHRVIRELAGAGDLPEKRRKHLKKLMAEYAEQSSLQERVAEEAERESTDLKKIEYMKDFTGQTMTGFISGVQSYGFFVELPNTVEGLVHVSTIDDDYYIYDEKHLRLIGEHTKRVFRIGDTVKVTLVRVDVEERRVDFELAAESTDKKKRKAVQPKKSHH